MQAIVPSKLLFVPGHLCFPYKLPIIAAALSPTPTANIPLKSGSKLKPAELVTSHGAGCNQRGREKPTKRYIGVSAKRPASFSSENTTNPFCKYCPNGGTFNIRSTCSGINIYSN